jgi:aromatic ring hydroxylase
MEGGLPMVKLSQDQLNHMIFLSEVVLHGNKRKAVMADALHMLLYLVKTTREVEVSDSVQEKLGELLAKIEEQLKIENDRKKKKRR